MANQDNKINKIKLPNGQVYEIDAKYWNGKETLTAADLGLSAALKYCGITTTKLEDGSTVNPVIIDGNDHFASAGCVVFYEDKEGTQEFVYNGSKWELLGKDLTYKVVQNPISSPNVSGDATAFIDTISQDANGVITATKKNVDMPIVKGDAENSAVLKGGNNRVISEGGVALGKDNLVGLKGWYYKAIQLNRSTNVTFLYLSKTQQVPVIVTSASEVEQEKDIDFTLIANDVVSVVNDSKYDNKYKISTNEIAKYGRIEIKSVDSNISFPFDKVNTDNELSNGIFDPEDYSIYCLSKPDAGIVNIGQDSFVSGYNNKATNGKSTAFGYNNHAYGKFSFVEGRGNEAGYAAHAEGRDCIAKGEMSHAGGLTTHANGKASFSHGQDTRANGHSSFAMGYAAKANGEQSISLGYNTSAEGPQTVALGNNTQAIGNVSHAENAYTIAEGRASHAEGFKSKVCLSEGNLNDNYERSVGYAAHAEGHTTQSIGCGAHSEGGFTTALGNFTHAEGYRTHAKGSLSHAEGKYTKTTNEAEHASGKYNVSTPKTADNTTANATHFSIGIGTSDTDRKNAFEVKQNGDIYVEGVEGKIQDKLNEISQINKTIEDNEEVIATALCELNEKVDEIENIPFEKGESENSAVLKGGDNTAVLKGWYYSSIYKESNSIITVYLDSKQKICVVDEPLKTVDQIPDHTLPNLANILGIGTIVSLINDAKYDNIFKIIDGSNGAVRLQTTDDSNIPFDVIKAEAINDPEDYSIYCVSQPDTGMFDMGQGSIAIGYNNKATNGKSTAFGYNNHAYGKFSFVEGRDNEAGYSAHAEGRGTKAIGETSHAEGFLSIASGVRSHAEGYNVKSVGENSHAEGNSTVASGSTSHAEGYKTDAQGKYSHAEGYSTIAQGAYSHTEGYSTIASSSSHAEGYSTEAAGKYSHAENSNTKATGQSSHAEGSNTEANNTASHSEGLRNKATGVGSHVEGVDCISNGRGGHAEGISTITNNDGEHACGQWNNSTKSSKSKGTRYSVGIGTSETDRKNAHEITNDGKHYILGIGGYDGTNHTNSEDVVTVINNINLGIQDKLDKLVNIKYLELKSLRDNSKLIPGQQYRITDYVTTTTQSNTQSAGHQFDIIVVADDVNVLNENTRAIQHEGDTYFSNSDLNAWELKYCLDNDTSRFAWADATNGKGVIYYMKDEFGNDCPYDFKNIQFARWQLSNPVGYRNDYDFDNWEDNWIRESTPFDSLKTGFYGLNVSEKVFYYGSDEYDEYEKYKVEYTISSSPTYCYTFGYGTDYSISGGNYGNVIKEYKNSKKITLNNIVFLSNSCYSNSFGNNCYSNSFGNNCYSNSFGNNCYSNSFVKNCYYNSFGYDCHSNSFGNYCSFNSFGYDCHYNSFGYDCHSNSFGKNFSSNSFGKNCHYNSFGKNCSFNSFGYDCHYNSFGYDCSSNSFGKNFSYNSFGKNCHYNSFGNNCHYNSFGYDCSYNSFGESKDNLKSYYRYIIFDNGNSYINLNCTSTTSTSKYYQNVRIGLGVNNTTTYKTINDSNVGQTYETCYKPANSQTITI